MRKLEPLCMHISGYKWVAFLVSLQMKDVVDIVQAYQYLHKHELQVFG